MRITIQECINVFNSNESMKYSAVRNMEQLGEWETAAKYWEKLNRKIDADACLMISDAIKKGDKYREAVSHLTNWIEDTVNNGLMSREEAVKFIYSDMQEIHNNL